MLDTNSTEYYVLCRTFENLFFRLQSSESSFGIWKVEGRCVCVLCSLMWILRFIVHSSDSLNLLLHYLLFTIDCKTTHSTLLHSMKWKRSLRFESWELYDKCTLECCLIKCVDWWLPNSTLRFSVREFQIQQSTCTIYSSLILCVPCFCGTGGAFR